MGREVDARTDIYALGVILYRMFAGRFPFQGSVVTELVFKHMTEVPTPPSLHRQMPPDLERIILDCLAKDPVSRPQSARLLADRLSAVAGTGTYLIFRARYDQPAADAAYNEVAPQVAHGVSCDTSKYELPAAEKQAC